MEAVTKLIEVLNKLGPTGLWLTIGLLACLILINFTKQLQELKASSLSVKEKKFEQLSKLVQEKDIYDKPGLLLEQAFESYFGFILGADEIFHILKSKKQTEAIRDLKYSRSMFKFENNEYIYIRKLKLKTRHFANNIVYWASSMLTIFVTIYALLPQNYPMLIFTVIFGLNVYLSLDTSRALTAAKRINDKYYGPKT